MLAVLTTGLIAAQISLFLPRWWPKPSPALMARLSGPEWPGKYLSSIQYMY